MTFSEEAQTGTESEGEGVEVVRARGENGEEAEQSKIRGRGSRGERETLIDSDVSLRELRQGFGIS